MSTGQPVLELTGVSRTYDDGVPVHALHPVDLVVRSGDYVTITGPSGAGKSTPLNVPGLLDSPSTGSYRAAGVETTDVDERTRVTIRSQLFGFVFQAFHLLPGRSARAAARGPRRTDPAGDRAAALNGRCREPRAEPRHGSRAPGKSRRRRRSPS
ncbi:ATP-binding cassette domain-containing protein [Streptomyces radiopugnans]|uniref:ATP-binding cassette domain-containing protein n=1 Tax=Streptomyces radiopugnans TaxID=403935 RepID=UPI003F1C1C49